MDTSFTAKALLISEPLESRRLLSAVSLDPTFGSGGEALLGQTASGADSASAIVVRPDGRVLVAGNYLSGGAAGTLSQFLPDGQPDPAFGNGGKLSIPFPGGHDFRGLLLEPDGSLIGMGAGTPAVQKYTPGGAIDPTWIGPAGTFATSDMRQIVDLGGGQTLFVVGQSLIKLTPSGTPDPTFGNNGRVDVTPSGYTPQFFPKAVAPELDGSLLLGGIQNTQFGQVAAVRHYSAAGKPDNAFGKSGTLLLPPDKQSSQVSGMRTLADGSVLVNGDSGTAPAQPFLSHLKADGSLDTGFGTNGIAKTSAGPLGSLAVLSDGSILTASGVHYNASTPGTIALQHFSAAGQPIGGAVTEQLPPNWIGFGDAYLAMQGGKPVVATTMRTAPTLSRDIALLRFNADLSPDTAFGAGGHVVIDYTGPAPLVSGHSALQPDGKIILIATRHLIEGHFIVSRLNADGTPDTSFADHGVADINLGSNTDFVTDATVQSDGKIVVVGFTAPFSPTDSGTFLYAAIRLNPDGSLDTSFGNGGKIISDFGQKSQGLFLVTTLPNGDILAGGYYYAANRVISLIRYSPDGKPDMAFGNAGLKTVALPGLDDTLTSLWADAAGRVYIEGSMGGANASARRFIARLKSDGGFDTTFGSAGTGRIVFDEASASVQSMRFTPNPSSMGTEQDLYVPGMRSDTPTKSLVISAVTPDGLLDPSFGVNGTASINLQNDSIYEVRAIPGGLVAAGRSAPMTRQTPTSMLVLRLESNGEPDPTFGPGGRQTISFGDGQDIANAAFGDAAGHVLAVGSAGFDWAAARLGNPASPPPANVINAVAGFTNTITLRRDAAGIVDDVWINAPATAAPTLLADPQYPLTINGSGAGDNLVLDNSSGNPLPVKLTLNGSFTTAALAIGANQTVTLAGAAAQNTLTVTSLTRDPTSTLDLGVGGLIVNYPDGSPSPLGTLSAAIRSACAGGTWTGAGITSGAAAASQGRGAVGFGEASTLLGLSGSRTATFMGQTVNAHSLLLRYTFAGDANLDGKVDYPDFQTLSSHFGQAAGNGWTAGDFNYNGTVDFSDFILLSNNFGKSLPPTPALAMHFHRRAVHRGIHG